MELTIERTIEIDDIEISKYHRETHDSPAEGGEVEGYKASWSDIVTEYKDGKQTQKIVYTELTQFEYDLFDEQITEYINDHYEPDEPDYDSKGDR